MHPATTQQSTLPIRPYNLKELSAIYGVSVRTINRWLKPFKTEIGDRNGYYYMIPQVEVIFSKLGFPGDG